ncbi:spermidine acetyltransferase, partial [Staphylococcus gallinarum]
VHIYQSQNFAIEGTLLEHFYTRGEYSDCYIMGLFKKNWVNHFDNDLSHIK